MARVALPHITLHYEQFGNGPDIVWVAGGGGRGLSWHRYQIPAFEADFRCTTYDNRGIGLTECDEPLPWTIADMAADAAALIEAVCEPPVVVVGQSMGGFIVTQLALDRPDLLRCVVASGTAAAGGRGWLGDYMRSEVDLRRGGGRLEGMFALTHYAAELYPARVLGDPERWNEIKEWMLEIGFIDGNERSLIPQWQACIDFDVVERLPECRVPFHIFAYAEDVQAPPQYGKQVADLIPGAKYHLFEGMGHGSLRGHGNEAFNAQVRDIVAGLGDH
jgi:pimeloyl-ACP methyl ester carboxylesterase